MKLQIDHLSKHFGDLTVFDQLSLTMESRNIYCLMAPSGKGKTTLFRILMGFEHADSGQITGLNHARISAVFQEDRLCEAFTPLDNVYMAAAPAFTKAQIRKELLALLPEDALNRPVCTLSGGQKRRTAICRALCAPFDLLIMDEPFTGLDEDTRLEVIQYIKKKSAGKLTLLSTHQQSDINALGGILIHL